MSATSQVPPTSERRTIRREGESQGILIVDDDELILRSIDRVLRRQAQESGWELHFVSDGSAALELLSQRTFSVALVDAQMPRMSGTVLLRKIQESHPGVIRILMSGHTDPGQLRTALSLAHQFIPKPCDAQHLKTTLRHACGLRNILDTLELRTLGDELPSAPRTYVEFSSALKNPRPSEIDALAALVEKDVALSARVLKFAASGFQGIPPQLGSVGEAVALLGFEVVRALLLSSELSKSFAAAPPIPDFSIEALQQHSAAAAQLAHRLLDQESDGESALIAGLLQDVGQLIFAARAAQRFSLALSRSSREQIPLYDVELELFGSTHAEVGGYLLGLWGLAPEIVHAVTHHLQPVDRARLFDPAAALYVANLLAANPDVPALDEVPARTIAIDLSYLRELGVAERLEDWRKIARDLSGFEMSDAVSDGAGVPALRDAARRRA